MMNKDNYTDFFWQTRNALVREIRDAQTWLDITVATKALIKVVRMGEEMKAEQDHLFEKSNENTLG